ncbi:hypothetical protein [Jiangella mangrovi]|uniref:Uncharacterized protein n=1 Tax=Jiangella mangrovi TaxID=1524084 RepID=A0A7W9GS43_9ACTN|nr:hypothetical protein [Jiangella mangrovi]MBB5788706.1 hypothetical protein [Jiangella mangrovi]
MPTIRRVVLPVAVVVAVLTAAACGSEDAGGEVAGPASAQYDCFGVVTTAAEWDDAPPVDGLEHPGLDAFAAATDGLDGWRALDTGDEELAAVRPSTRPTSWTARSATTNA